MKQTARVTRLFVQAFTFCAWFMLAGKAALAQEEAVFAEPQPVTLANSMQYDLKSAITGRDYRIFVSAPADAGPDKAYPVLYTFDGNRNFQQAAVYTRGIVVSIGYPVQDLAEFERRRQQDLTPTVDATRAVPTGDADNFLLMLEREIRPFVAARYKLVADQQAIYGYSLGGLAVLRHMFRNPQAFNAFIIVSPSIWWDDKVVLADEAAFSERVKNESLQMRVLLTSAGDEQNCSAPDAAATCLSARMVDNASELAARLRAISPDTLQVTRIIFEGESHGSVSRPALGRALSFLRML